MPGDVAVVVGHGGVGGEVLETDSYLAGSLSFEDVSSSSKFGVEVGKGAYECLSTAQYDRNS